MEESERKRLPTTRDGFKQAVTDQEITFLWYPSAGPHVNFGDSVHKGYEPMGEDQVFLLLGRLTRLYQDQGFNDWWVSPTHIRAWATDLAREGGHPPLPKNITSI